MAKSRTLWRCTSCRREQRKWFGRCPGCGDWDTLVELTEGGSSGAGPKAALSRALSGRVVDASSGPVALTEVDGSDEPRTPIGIGELDRVLGGGLVAGSVVLVGGEPGVGKSTILLQAAGRLATEGRSVLYVSGEESQSQIKLRADRLGVSSSSLLILTETSLELIVQQAETTKPTLLIVDSVQTMASQEVVSAPGSVTQLRAVTGLLVTWAKRTGTPLLLVGHVTKGGQIAGPKLLEHMVDTVLYFEGRQGGPYRLVRAVKNRFGSTNEVGVFEMRGSGLTSVSNPSKVFLAERPKNQPGSVVVCTLEGTRPFLAEVQALVTTNNHGPPRVNAIGVDAGRVLLMLNIMQKRGNLDVLGCDVFVNVVGGIRIVEPAADLALIAALASSFWDRPVCDDTVLIGEVGLTGEVRSVNAAGVRVSEAARLGFGSVVIPQGNLEGLEEEELAPIGLSAVRSVPEALELVLPRS